MTAIYAIPAFSDNYIWVIASPDGDIALVDPGDANAVRDWLAQHDVRLTDILVTHHHPDHTGAIDTLAAKPGVRVHGPAHSPFRGITHPLRDGDTLRLLGADLAIRAVPGHTLDHIAYFAAAGQLQRHPVLFSGDTLFAGGCGRLFEGTAAMMYQSLHWMANLPHDTAVYCAHEYTLANLRFAAAVEPGNVDIRQRLAHTQALREQGMMSLPTTIGLEILTNPFLRVAEPAVQAAAAQHGKQAVTTPVEVFAVIRSWKDTF